MTDQTPTSADEQLIVIRQRLASQLKVVEESLEDMRKVVKKIEDPLKRASVMTLLARIESHIYMSDTWTECLRKPEESVGKI